MVPVARDQRFVTLLVIHEPARGVARGADSEPQISISMRRALDGKFNDSDSQTAIRKTAVYEVSRDQSHRAGDDTGSCIKVGAALCALIDGGEHIISYNTGDIRYADLQKMRF